MTAALAALAVLVAVSWALGHGALRRGGGGPDGELRPVVDWIAGLVLLYLLLLGLDLFGLRWHLATLVPAVAALTILGWLDKIGDVWLVVQAGRLHHKQPRRLHHKNLNIRWGDAVAAGAFLVFVVCTALLWNLHPDFIYHWGLKGWKFTLARGLDFAWLASPEAAHAHPDYPNLVPSLFALTAILGGSFRELPMVLWSALFFALTVLAARALLDRLGASTFARQAGVALVGLTLAMFGVGYLQAGGADGLIALAMVAGAAILASEPDRRTDVHIGWVAAFAAAAKIEGMALATWLVATYLLRRWRRRDAGFPRQLPLTLGRTLLPAAAVAGVWAWQIKVHGLFQPANVGALDPGRVGVVFPELLHSLLTVNWHGLPFCLFALPLLLAASKTRAIAGVVCLQLAFYVYVYLSASVDPRQYVITSAARLYFHLVPVVLVLVIAAADRLAGGEPPRG